MARLAGLSDCDRNRTRAMVVRDSPVHGHQTASVEPVSDADLKDLRIVHRTETAGKRSLS